MKKIVVTGIVVIVFAVYAIFYNKPVSATINTLGKSSTSSGDTTTPQSGKYKDGSYTGQAEDAFYGIIQVKAIVKNGKLSDIQFLQYPHDKQESVLVNQAAMPKLEQEAIQIQSSQVDIVTGATQTSQAFRQSLASALAEAK